jgi:hypothetical protein
MATMNIPEDGLQAMAAIANWTAQQFDAFIVALREMPAQVPMQPVLMRVLEKTKLAEPSVATSIVAMIASVFHTRKSFVGDDAAYVAKLAETTRTTADSSLGINDARSEVLRERLGAILACKKISHGIKATNLFFERPNIATEFKIITDARPIFGPDEETTSSSFMVVHTLKVEYHVDGQSKELFLGVDDSDLKALIDVTNRATTKEAAIRKEFEKAGLLTIRVNTSDE